MKRKDFFKSLLGIAAVAVVAPSVLVRGEPRTTGVIVPKRGRIGRAYWVEGADHVYDFGSGGYPEYRDRDRSEFFFRQIKELDKQQMRWFKFQSEIDKQFPI